VVARLELTLDIPVGNQEDILHIIRSLPATTSHRSSSAFINLKHKLYLTILIMTATASDSCTGSRIYIYMHTDRLHIRLSICKICTRINTIINFYVV
jgi:hypothetical protein